MKTDYYVYVLYRDTGEPFYVGKGRRDRWLHHEREARKIDTHRSRLIRKILKKLGEVPKRKVLENLTNEQAITLERSLIASIGREPHGPLINQTRGGDGLVDAPAEVYARIGQKNRLAWAAKPLEERQRIIVRLQSNRKPPTPESIEKCAAKLRGQRRSLEARAKMSAAKKGKPGHPMSVELRERLAIRNSYKRSSETRQKMRLAKLGKKLSQEHRKKIGDAHRGRTLSSEHRAKLSVARIGMKFTSEHRANIGRANQRRANKGSPTCA